MPPNADAGVQGQALIACIGPVSGDEHLTGTLRVDGTFYIGIWESDDAHGPIINWTVSSERDAYRVEPLLKD